MTKISFCITYYNQENFVKKSLDSILAIDLPADYEILIGDDGSTDSTVEIAKQYQSRLPDRITIYKNKRDSKEKQIGRASKNRLNLAQKAKGDYIIFLDGDDFYCDTEFIKQAISILDKNTTLIACGFNFKYLYEDNTERDSYQRLTGEIKAVTYVKNCYTHSGAIVFRNILDEEKIQYLQKINNFDDNAITIYFLQFGNLYFVNRTIYAYRQSSESLWNSFNDTEQNLLNALDYNLISRMAPKFKKEIAKRQYGGIKYIFKNRKKLAEDLGAKYSKYIKIAETNKDEFIYNLLKWNKLDLKTKMCTYIKWIKYKTSVKI